MHHRLAPLALLLAPLLSLGCGPKEQQFAVAVKNGTDGPITVGLAKEGGGPYEYEWATPEQAAMERVTDVPDPKAPRNWGLTVPPGRIADRGTVKGRFARGARPVLRVYGSDHPLEQILAISRGSSNRVDVNLSPGRNEYTVVKRDGRLVAEPGVVEDDKVTR